MIINLFIPILLIYIISKNLQIFFKREFIQSLFLTNIFIIFYYYLILKINFFWIGNYFLFFSIFLILIIKFKKNKKIYFNIKDFSIILLTSLSIYFLCKNFYLYKYDEFSEYGIITKVTFFLDTLPVNTHDLLHKGSYHKINLLSAYYIFFLKNSFIDFNETILIFSNIFFIIILILAILNELKNLSFPNKIIFFFVIIIITYMLNSGLDRIYPETIMALLVSYILILADKINNKFNSFDFIILISCLLIIFATKQSGIIIFALVSLLIILNFLILKKYSQILIMFALLFGSYFWINVHNIPVEKSSIEKVEKSKIKIETLRITNSYKFNENYQIITGSIIKNEKITFKNITNSLYVSNIKESIYHLYSFNFIENILKFLNINFKGVKLSLNFVFWFSTIIFLYIIDKKTFLKNNYYYLIAIIFCFFSYQLIIILWAYNHNLILADGTLIVSWSRHVGVLVSGFFIFYLLKIYETHEKFHKKFLLILIIFIIIFMPTRTVRGIIPTNIENKIPFWSNKFATRNNIKNISSQIRKVVPEKSIVFYLNDNIVDPYFFPILNYELININLINSNRILLKKQIRSFVNVFFILSDKKNLNYLKVKYKKILDLDDLILLQIN